ARTRFDGVAVVDGGGDPSHRRIEGTTFSGNAFQFAQQGIPRFRFATQGAQYIQALDVAAAFPDGIQRCLAIEPRQDVLFDIAQATQAFLRLVDHRRAALADVVLAYRRGDPRQ